MDQLERDIYQFLKDRNWHELRPGDVAKSIMIEGAELLELFQWDNPTLAEVKVDAERLERIKRELADVMIFALELAALLDLDAETIIRAKLAQSAKKYPAELVRGHTGEPGTEALYWQIKRDHRKHSS